jgi:hypothetical protein
VTPTRSCSLVTNSQISQRKSVVWRRVGTLDSSRTKPPARGAVAASTEVDAVASSEARSANGAESRSTVSQILTRLCGKPACRRLRRQLCGTSHLTDARFDRCRQAGVVASSEVNPLSPGGGSLPGFPRSLRWMHKTGLGLLSLEGETLPLCFEPKEQ